MPVLRQRLAHRLLLPALAIGVSLALASAAHASGSGMPWEQCRGGSLRLARFRVS